MIHKKISGDVLHLALLLAIVRLVPDIRREWNQPLEVGDMYLGSTLAYRRFYSEDINLRSSRYISLKNLDPFLLDEITSVRYRSFFSSDRDTFRENVIAYFSDPPEVPSSPGERQEEPTTNATSNTENRENTGIIAAQSGALSQSLENIFSTTALELSREDMDLIEILWKQDIDLGVSREAFNAHDNHEIEKLKADPEFTKKESPIGLEKSFEPERDSSLLSNQNEDFIYVVDSETGEHVMQQPKEVNDSVENLPVEQSLLSFEDFEEFTTSLFSLEDDFDQGFDLTKELFTDNYELSDDLNFDPDDLSAQLEKFEEPILGDSNELLELDMASEMYPSMEEYWQDISTTLPLSVMNQACLLPRPSRDYPESIDDHSGASTSSDVAVNSITPNSAFAGALLHNASLIQRDPEANSSFTYLSHIFNPTSLGCAVASSIATLTNDSDPMPDVTSSMNSTFGMDLPALLPVNQTSQPSTSETLLSDLLEDDLQLMDVAAALPPPPHLDVGSCRSFSLMRIFDHGTESDDSVSSPDYSVNKVSKLEELTPSACGDKEVAYGTFKYPAHPTPINCGFRQIDTSLQSGNFGMAVQMSPFADNYNCVQHNHTYPLPFTSSNNVPKPVTRDKSRYDKDNNSVHARDEKKAKSLDLPMTISEIINLAIDEFNEKLTKFELTEHQHTLIRDIRRRGKNKVAAQNCRKRKMDQISGLQQDLGLLREERLQLEADRVHLIHQRRSIREKYSKLCQLVLQSSTTNPPMLSEFTPVDHQSSNAALPSSSDSPEPENDMNFNQGVRAKRKMGKKN